MRISTNLSLGFAIFIVVVSGIPYVRGYKVSCASTPPGAHQVEPGSVLNLTCLSGTERLLVWSKNGKPITDNVRSVQIPGSNVKSLVTSIRNASIVDSGRYECRDKGGTSYDACEWRLDVFAPPYIKLISPGYEHLEGATTYIICRALGYPPPIYKWLFNGIEVKTIISAPHDLYGVSELGVKNNHGESFLEISLADTGHSGTYTCIANNSRGQDEKSTALLIRETPLPVVHTAKYKVIKERQQNVTLRCMATDIFKTQTTVTWHHDNSQLFYHKEQFFSNNTVASRLMIHNASDEDVGIYWCHVKVFSTVEKSRTQLIRAKEGLPSVSTEKPIVISRLGERLTLSCTVTYPRYDVITTSWTKNGSILAHQFHTFRHSPKETREKHSEVFTFYLSIKNFTLDDVGTFVCRVESMTGTNWTSIEVQIQKQIVHDQYPSGEQRVSTPSLVIIFLVAALGSIFAIVTAITIRFLYILRHKKLAARYKNSSSSQEYRYETFLSFSNHDYKWVTTHVIPLLDKYSFKYCITRKDFEVGKAMIENIADSIYQSRTVIAIVSENFMASQHCQQELDLALYKSAELDDGSLIVIRIDSIQKGLLPKALRNRTFLDYADTEERKHWERRLLKCLFSHTRNSTKCEFDL